MESLDTFRTVSFAADFASERLPPVTVSGGDFKGRVFRLSLTDGGQPTQAEGVQCRLGWNADPGEALGSYVEAARVDGTDTATWEVEVPSSMLAQPRCKAAWMLYTAGTANVLCTLAFDVAVERPVVDTGSAEGEDLVDRLWTAIDTMEQATDNANAATESAHKAADAAAEAAAAAQATGNVLTAEASGELVNVSDAYPGTLLTTKVYGKSEQVSTTGAQLMQLVNDDFAMDGSGLITDKTPTADHRGWSGESAEIVSDALPAGSYTLTFETVKATSNENAGCRVYKNGNPDQWLNVEAVGLTELQITAAEGDVFAILTKIYDGAYRVMLNAGTEALPWEPYSGGVASPSPEWPQAIESVTSAEVVAAGGNLLILESIGRLPTTQSTSFVADGITWSLLGDGTVRASGTATAKTYCYGNQTHLPAGTYTTDECRCSTKQPTFTLQEPEGVIPYIEIVAGTVVNATYRPMLNVGTSALPWSPAGTVRHPLDLQGHELRSLPDGTRDELVVNADGSYGIVQRVGRTTVSAAAYFDGQTAEYVEFVAPAYNASSDVVGARSTHAANDNDNRITSAYGVLYWRIPIAQATAHGLTTLDSVNAWLVSNPMTVDYALATETYIPLGTLDPAPSWPDEGVNNAWTVSDLPTETGVGYIQSAQIVHDRQEARLAALETAIATMEA